MLIAIGCILSLVLAHRAIRAGHSPWFHILMPWLGPIGVLVSAHRTRQPQIPAVAFARARFHAEFGDCCRIEGLYILPGSVSEINRVQTVQRVSEYRFRLLALGTLNFFYCVLLWLDANWPYDPMARVERHAELWLCLASYLAWAVSGAGLIALGQIAQRLGLRFFERARMGLLLCGVGWGLLATMVCVVNFGTLVWILG